MGMLDDHGVVRVSASRRCALTLALCASLTPGCLVDRGDLTLDARVPRDASVDASADIGIECHEGGRVCDGVCVDVTSDPAHCGGCGMACGDGQSCVASTCGGCDGVVVYGVCTRSLRVWLDARNPAGDGTPGADGPLSRWANLAPGAVGDAVPDLGSPMLTTGAGGRRVVQLESARLATGAITSDGDAIEIFLVARTRMLAGGVTLAFGAGTAASALDVRLPDDGGTYLFGLPTDMLRLAGPFGRDVRQTTLWHAFGGPGGAEVRVDATPVSRSAGAPIAYGAPLLLGADAAGKTQSLDVSELLVFDHALSDVDRATISASLLARWELGSPATPPPDGLNLWLDAREPLRGGMPTDGEVLARWDDRSTRSAMATTTRATYRASGLGPGRAAVELDRDQGESSVAFARPVSDDVTLLVVLATDDGSGEGEGWSSPNVLGADQRYPGDDAAIVMSAGRVGVGRDPAGTPFARNRIDDGAPHVVILRRWTHGLTQMWVDHEPVLQAMTAPGNVVSPLRWYLGRHEDANEGALAARYGEVLVYGRALDDEELSNVERYLVRRWATAPLARVLPLGACAPGTMLACPARSLAELRGMPTGRYWIDLGAGPHHVWIDGDEGGGWALVLQYVRAANTYPELDVIQPGEDWPLSSPTALGGTDVVRSPRWGHLGQASAALIAGASELRWYAASSGHARIIHFRSSAGVAAWQMGVNDFAGVVTTSTLLTGASAALPGTATNFGYAYTPDTVLTSFPFFQYGTAHWAVGASGRWEVDDVPYSGVNATVHRIWVR
ncbi:MAG: hypothetical protein K1X94_25480 [Sandaracinaceae bacterium]|nr:hypothetical protein [Sandaracinaceae bacterium]